ncbi:hypothetical protein ABW21_db0203162 [Orbilia brochopaga]|nr:hypothetical protein ABW21_db0203162 [Drechslerella brochopaga]
MKNIYLPNFVIALLRTPRLPPTYAQFSVPLNFNKLDLRNYLKNAYGLRVIGIRSSIRHSPVILEQKRGGPKRYMRKRAEKRMTIEMTEPFVWPEEPTDLSKYDNALYKNIEKYREKIFENARDGGRGRLVPDDERKKIAQAVAEKLKAEAAGPTRAAEELTDVDFDSVISGGKPKSRE